MSDEADKDRGGGDGVAALSVPQDRPGGRSKPSVPSPVAGGDDELDPAGVEAAATKMAPRWHGTGQPPCDSCRSACRDAITAYLNETGLATALATAKGERFVSGRNLRVVGAAQPMPRSEAK